MHTGVGAPDHWPPLRTVRNFLFFLVRFFLQETSHTHVALITSRHESPTGNLTNITSVCAVFKLTTTSSKALH